MLVSLIYSWYFLSVIVVVIAELSRVNCRAQLHRRLCLLVQSVRSGARVQVHT